MIRMDRKANAETRGLKGSNPRHASFILIVFSLFVSNLFGAGCSTTAVKPCINHVPSNCVGSNVYQVCEQKDGCRHCYCTTKPGQQSSSSEMRR